ncbi:hypothetical protein PRZ48_001001 [Zasmidium cellare]|uniref:Uncharacterized protein n=1 Tax=Zasmidium cellare TaxID=395010 RepID=A0ABR0F1M1_ZASCE|nr:hypothetical protein PRZ48_001001 [Zasmidium cellare]
MGKNLSSFLRLGRGKKKEQQPQDEEQGIELVTPAPKTPTPAPSHQPGPASHRPVPASSRWKPAYTPTPAECSLDECLPVFAGSDLPHERKRFAWQDKHDRDCFILEALIYISGRGTVSLDDKTFDIHYSHCEDQCRAQLITFWKGQVFGLPIKHEGSGRGEVEALIILKDEIRRCFEWLMSRDIPHADECPLLQRWYHLKCQREREERMIAQEDPSRSILPPAPSAVPRPTSPPWRRKTEPPGADLVRCLGAQSSCSNQNKIREHRSMPSLKTLSKQPVRNDDPTSRTVSYDDLSAEEQARMIRAEALKSSEHSGRHTTPKEHENISSPNKEPKQWVHSPFPTVPLYYQIFDKQHQKALKMGIYRAAETLSIPVNDVREFVQFPDRPHQQQPRSWVHFRESSTKDLIGVMPKDWLKPSRLHEVVREEEEEEKKKAVSKQDDDSRVGSSRVAKWASALPVVTEEQVSPLTTPIQNHMGTRAPSPDQIHGPQAGSSQTSRQAAPQPAYMEEEFFPLELPAVQNHPSGRTSSPDLYHDPQMESSRRPQLKTPQPAPVEEQTPSLEPPRVQKRACKKVSFPDLASEVSSSRAPESARHQATVEGAPEEQLPRGEQSPRGTTEQHQTFPDPWANEIEADSSRAAGQQNARNKSSSTPKLSQTAQAGSCNQNVVEPQGESSRTKRRLPSRYKYRNTPGWPQTPQGDARNVTREPSAESNNAAAQQAISVRTPSTLERSQPPQAESSRGPIAQAPTPRPGTNTRKPSCLKLPKEPVPQDSAFLLQQPEVAHQRSMTSLPQQPVQYVQQPQQFTQHYQQQLVQQPGQQFMQQPQFTQHPQQYMQYPGTPYMQQPQMQYMQQPQAQYIPQLQPQYFIQPPQPQYIIQPPQPIFMVLPQPHTTPSTTTHTTSSSRPRPSHSKLRELPSTPATTPSPRTREYPITLSKTKPPPTPKPVEWKYGGPRPGDTGDLRPSDHAEGVDEGVYREFKAREWREWYEGMERGRD